MASGQKRCRASNFTKEDQLLLVEVIKKFKHFVENKATDKMSWREKAEAWKKVEVEYNAQSSTKRTLQQLQGKYENLKTEVRKATAAHRLAWYGTGGGPSDGDVKYDPVLLAILELLNEKTVIGIPSQFDCDADCYQTNGSSESHLENDDVQVVFECDLNVPSTSSSSSDEQQESGNIVVAASEAKEVEVNVAVCKTPEEATKSNDWSDYTPAKLKRKVSAKLRPNPITSAKEAYYEAKRRLIEKEIEALQKREDREREEHEKKMLLLDLEIKNKTK